MSVNSFFFGFNIWLIFLEFFFCATCLFLIKIIIHIWYLGSLITYYVFLFKDCLYFVFESLLSHVSSDIISGLYKNDFNYHSLWLSTSLVRVTERNQMAPPLWSPDIKGRSQPHFHVLNSVLIGQRQTVPGSIAARESRQCTFSALTPLQCKEKSEFQTELQLLNGPWNDLCHKWQKKWNKTVNEPSFIKAIHTFIFHFTRIYRSLRSEERIYKSVSWAGEIAQCVKCLLCKYEDLN